MARARISVRQTRIGTWLWPQHSDSDLGNYLLDRLTIMAHNHYMEAPKTLQEAIIYFAEFENCKAFMVLSSLARWCGEVPALPI